MDTIASALAARARVERLLFGGPAQTALERAKDRWGAAGVVPQGR